MVQIMMAKKQWQKNNGNAHDHKDESSDNNDGSYNDNDGMFTTTN